MGNLSETAVCCISSFTRVANTVLTLALLSFFQTSSLESNLERLAHILTVEQDVFNERLLTLLPQWYCTLLLT